MIQIAYVSSTRGLLTTEELASLLVTSRVRNHDRGITGVLLYHGGNVLQIIEGGEQPVLELFAKIERDPRHSGVVQIYQESITDRDFAEWTMGLVDLDSNEARQLEGYSEILKPGFDLRSLTRNSAGQLIRSFRRSMR